MDFIAQQLNVSEKVQISDKQQLLSERTVGMPFMERFHRQYDTTLDSPLLDNKEQTFIQDESSKYTSNRGPQNRQNLIQFLNKVREAAKIQPSGMATLFRSYISQNLQENSSNPRKIEAFLADLAGLVSSSRVINAEARTFDGRDVKRVVKTNGNQDFHCNSVGDKYEHSLMIDSSPHTTATKMTMGREKGNLILPKRSFDDNEDDSEEFVDVETVEELEQNPVVSYSFLDTPNSSVTAVESLLDNIEETEENKMPAVAPIALTGEESLQNSEVELIDEPVDKDRVSEPTYCYCKDVFYGEMICCENPSCEEWFHFECVNMKKAPKGHWYCWECNNHHNKRVKKSKSESVGMKVHMRKELKKKPKKESKVQTKKTNRVVERKSKVNVHVQKETRGRKRKYPSKRK